MTFSEWMSKNGYQQYNSAAGRKELQKKYGITETDPAKANMALWAKLRAEKASSKKLDSSQTKTSSAPQNIQLRQWAQKQDTVAYFLNESNTNQEYYKKYLNTMLKYASPEIASRIKHINNLGTDETAKAHNQQAALNQVQYEYATQAKNGLFSSTENGTGPAHYDRERAAAYIEKVLKERPDVKAALAKKGMSAEEFLQQLERTYAGHNDYGTKVQEQAYVNKANKELVQAANDAAMSSWLNANITNATSNAARAGLSYALNAPSFPAALVATGVHNIIHSEDKESMGDVFDRQFGWTGNPRKIFGSGENAELDTGSNFVNFIGNVATDPLTYITWLTYPKGSTTLTAGPDLYNQAAQGITRQAPMLGEDIVAQTVNYIPKQTFKLTSKGNYPRGQQLATYYGVPKYLGDMSRTITYPTMVGGIPGVSFIPGAAGSPTQAVFTPEYLPEYQEQVKYIKDWGDDCVQEAFRQAAARGAKEGEIITGPCGKSYIYTKDPNFTGRITVVNPNQLTAGGTNNPIITEVTNNIDEVPESVVKMRIPAEYRAIVTDNHNISTTPTYHIGKRTLNYFNY